ncbi:HNH endonuclease [Acidithiobacillus thiooxidans]|nr:HNH endonuclease [Acidithiobacillus thiooxidans]
MPIEAMEADHIIPWSQGGRTTSENCQMVSKLANRRKSDS